MATTQRKPFPLVTNVIDILKELMEYLAEFGELEPRASST